MRWIDQHVGSIIATPLSLFIKSSETLPDKSIKNIVVSKYFGLGSITLSTPLLQSIRARFPHAKIHFLTFRENAGLLELYPFIDEVIAIRQDSIPHFITDTLGIIFRLLRKKIDLFIDVEFFSHYSALIALMTGSRYRVGFHSSLLPRGKLLTHRVRFNPQRYITEAFSELGRNIGAKKEFPLYEPDLEANHDRILEWLSGHGVKEYEFIAINTKGSDLLGVLNQWPDKKWRELITRIVREKKLNVILTGVKSDRRDINKIIKPLPPEIKGSVFNSAGEFNFHEFLSVIHGAKLLITVDSGPLHLAQSLGIPCVAMFGPDNPVLYGPRGEMNRTEYLGLYCSPCYNVLEGKRAECKNKDYNICMKKIDVDSVWNDFVDLLDQLKKNGSA